jgi:hypothetical protein
VRWLKVIHGDRRRRHQQRPGLPVGAEVGRRMDRDDAGPCARGLDIDAADAPVRDRAAQEGRMHHVGKCNVIDEQRPSGKETPVFVAFDRGAKILCRHFAPNRCWSDLKVP